jgi:hypothetical protein
MRHDGWHDKKERPLTAAFNRCFVSRSSTG